MCGWDEVCLSGVRCGGVVCVGGLMYLCFCCLLTCPPVDMLSCLMSPFSSSVELCVTFDASSYTVDEGETASLKINLNRPSTIPISVMVMLTDGSAVGE